MSRDLKNEERLFGTDGIRGTVNKGKITALMAVKLAMAAGDYFFGRAGTKTPRVLIGKDTRLSGYMLEPALVSGFSPSILKSILKCEDLSPMKVMLDTIGSERYNKIKIVY